jgi:peptidoglycan-associated lipoprotein
VQDIFFDYDSYDVRSDAGRLAFEVCCVPGAASQHQGADWRLLRRARIERVQPDARPEPRQLREAGAGTGRRRSRSLRVVSYGKEKPFCTESTEECWQQNRRAGFTIDR